MTFLLSYVTPLRLVKSALTSNNEDKYETPKVDRKNEDETQLAAETDIDVITKKDLLKMENNINKAITSLTDSVKNDIKEIIEVISSIPKLISRMDNMEKENFELKNSINKVNGYILIEEEERKKLNNKLLDLEDKLKNKPAVEIIESNIIPTVLDERIEKLEKQIEKVTVHRYQNKRDIINGKKNVVVNETSELVANADVILLTTSNGKKINTDILDHKSTTQNFTCYTYSEVKEFCNKVNIQKQPRKILLHCGNNDLDREVDSAILKKELKEVIDMLRMTFNNSQIVLSSLFPRGEEHLQSTIDSINEYMDELTTITPNTIMMNNKEVKKKMLQNDNKHLKKEGFFIFLTNLRFVLYGQLPKINKRKPFWYTHY